MTNYTGNTEIVVSWIDGKREPKCKPDPNFPNGKDLDIFLGPDESACVASLPYPAPRCGYLHVLCKVCGFSVLITTAGRPDDPRSITLPCESHSA